MSEHSQPNFSRSTGSSGRGVFVAVAVIVAIVALIALVGSYGADTAGDTPVSGGNAITPAAPAIETPAPVATE